MDITSENKTFKFWRYTSAQVRYAVTYMIITTVVLAFLNLYCAHENEMLFSQSKKASLTEKAKLVASEIAINEQNDRSMDAVISKIKSQLELERVLVTDMDGNPLHDSDPSGEMPIPNEILTPDTTSRFYWDYHNGIMTAAVAVPIQSENAIIGQVYLLEINSSDGQLLHNMQVKILNITVTLELILLLFSIVYVVRYSHRLKEIMGSMRIIQEGDYSHKIQMHGHDELSFLADEFNCLTERLQTSENKRRQFVSDASHELKTPLASIKLLSDSILQYDMDVSTIREFAGDIGNEADRLTRMTNKLLALTKDESNTSADDTEIVYMAPTIRRVVKMLDEIAVKNNITIHLDLKNDSTVLLQEDDLYQIAFNLVENGIKYNVPGGKLFISLHRQEDMAVLRVRDTGVGIAPEALGHVFERFYRVDKARSRQTGGSGLGLSIVRSMVERNHGEIHLKSTPGKGTTFTVTFPCFDLTEEEINSISSEENQ